MNGEPMFFETGVPGVVTDGQFYYSASDLRPCSLAEMDRVRRAKLECEMKASLGRDVESADAAGSPIRRD